MKNFTFEKKNIKKPTAHTIFGIIAVLSCVAIIFLLAGPSLNQKNSTKNTTTTSSSNSLTSRKDFTMFIDKSFFTSKKTSSSVTVTSIKDPNILLVARGLHGVSYAKLCEQTKKDYTEISDYTKLNVETVYRVYSKTENDLVTTIYCIDDGLGSSIEIKYTYPSDDENHKEAFDILLSTFKLTSYKR